MSRPPIGISNCIAIPVWVKNAVLAAQLEEHDVTRAEFDVFLGRGPRWTDNAVNASSEMPVDAATEILTEIWTRWKQPTALAFLDRIRARIRGTEAPLPMVLPDATVAPLIAAPSVMQ